MTTTLPGAWTLEQFTTTIHEGQVGLWSWDPKARTADLDGLAQAYWDVDGAHQRLDDLFARIDGRDREDVRRRWLESATSPAPYEFLFRLPNPDGEGATRWISARGVGGREGVVDGQVLAVFADVTQVKRAEETRDLALREMTHRIGNLFAVAAGVTGLAARTSDSVDAMRRDLVARFNEMGEAFRYAANPDEMRLERVTLRDLLSKLLQPHDFGRGRVRFAVDDVDVGGRQITNVALVVHELATNALKHGALSEPDGRVEVEARREGDRLRLVWREHGGPGYAPPRPAPDAKPAKPGGFGTRLIDQTVRSAFAGTVERRAENGALLVEITMDATRLTG